MQNAMIEWANSNPIRLVVEPEPGPGREGVEGLWLSAIEPPSNELRLCAGDALHNLSAAMDHMAAEIVLLFGGNVNRARFPFHETRKNVEMDIAKDFPRSLPDDVKICILDTIRPYKDGNFALWATRKLDNIDKHRMIIPTPKVTTVFGLSCDGGFGGRCENFTARIAGDGRIGTCAFIAPITNVSYRSMEVEFFFNEPAIFSAPADVFSFFKYGSMAVEDAIQHLQSLLYGENAAAQNVGSQAPIDPIN
jgi:hypothetical protein